MPLRHHYHLRAMKFLSLITFSCTLSQTRSYDVNFARWKINGGIRFLGTPKAVYFFDFRNGEESNTFQEVASMTWIEVQRWIEVKAESRSPRIGILPLGACEQHGPTGLIGTYEHMIEDILESFERSGLTHVLLLNGHGGNIMPAKYAVSKYYGRYQDSLSDSATDGITSPPLKILLHSWYTGREVSNLARKLYGDDIGQHATPDEVAITQYMFPECIKTHVFNDGNIQKAKELGGQTKRIEQVQGVFALSYMCPEDFKYRFPDGRMGSKPYLANAEDGMKLFRSAVNDVIQIVQEWISEL